MKKMMMVKKKKCLETIGVGKSKESLLLLPDTHTPVP